MECNYVYKIIQQYHLQQKSIKIQCNKIKKLIMILINKSGQEPQTVQQFKEKQIRYLKNCNNYLQFSWNKINQSINNIYKNFIGHTKDVQYEWKLIINDLNKNIENSLKHCIKSSLLEFSRAINGDNKNKRNNKTTTSGGDRDRDKDEDGNDGTNTNSSNISPLFKVSMILDPRTNKINFTPSIMDLTQMVSSISRSLLESSKHIKRINESQDDDSIFNIISKEEEIIKSFVSIMEGISSVATEIDGLIKEFETKYKQIWDMDKDKFILRMSHSKQSLESFEKHIIRYKDWEKDILHEESTYNIKFININCNDLKKILIEHCKEWQLKLTNLLKKKH